MRGSFAYRLTVAFADAGLAGALVTAILVIAAFGGRFSSYRTEQRAARGRQLIAILADVHHNREITASPRPSDPGPTARRPGSIHTHYQGDKIRMPIAILRS